MRFRTLLTVAAAVLLVAAVTEIDTQHVVWDPPRATRVRMGAAGVLLALAATLVGRPRGDDA